MLVTESRRKSFCLIDELHARRPWPSLQGNKRHEGQITGRKEKGIVFDGRGYHCLPKKKKQQTLGSKYFSNTREEMRRPMALRGMNPRPGLEERPVCWWRSWPPGSPAFQASDLRPQSLDALLPCSWRPMLAWGVRTRKPWEPHVRASSWGGCQPALGPCGVHIPVPAARVHIRSAEGGAGVG